MNKVKLSVLAAFALAMVVFVGPKISEVSTASADCEYGYSYSYGSMYPCVQTQCPGTPAAVGAAPVGAYAGSVLGVGTILSNGYVLSTPGVVQYNGMVVTQVTQFCNVPAFRPQVVVVPVQVPQQVTAPTPTPVVVVREVIVERPVTVTRTVISPPSTGDAGLAN